MGVVRAARLGRPRRARARRNWPNLSGNPVLSIMLRERKGGCPWCSPGGSCHHWRSAALGRSILCGSWQTTKRAALAAHFGGGLHDFVLFVAPIGIFFLNRRIR